MTHTKKKKREIPYSEQLNNLLKLHGLTRKWISESMGITRTTFWRQVHNDTFIPEQKEIIRKRIEANSKIK